jgi:hypothetical protein
MLRLGLLLVTLVVCLYLPAVSVGSQLAALQTRFMPDRIGEPTTIRFGFQIRSRVSGRVPSPLINVDLHLPAGMGLASSTLGLATCAPAVLLAQGPEGCPANSRLGLGMAVGEVSANGIVTTESAAVAVVVGPLNSERVEEVLFFAEGYDPVFAQLVFSGRILADRPPFSGRLDTSIPLIPTWPGGPYVSVTSLSSTIGPLGLIYYRHRRGKLVPYEPRGITVPTHCPREGFPFRADFAFLDGTHAIARSVVPCPR